jgi:hypothetical protein
MNLRIQNARFECENLSQLGIDNASLSFIKQKDGYLLTTAISIDETRVDQVINIPGIIGGAIRRQPRGIVPAILQKTALEATLELNRNLLIDTNIGRLLLDGQMTVRGTLAQPRFNGILKVVEGRIQYLDREFELEEGTLRQYEPFEINPDIDISATTQISDLTTANPIEYTISIAIRGTLKDPEVTITSSPPLEEPEIVNLLTLGTTEGVSGLQERTGEILSSQITGLGSQILEQSLGISNVSITGNIFSIPENGGLTLTLREDITSDLSIAYQTDITNPSTQGFLISYRLFQHFRVIGQTQTDGVSDIGFRYILRR